MTDDQSLTVRNHLLEHEEEPPEPYQIKNIDLRLLDEVSEKIAYLLINEKKLRPIDKSDALKVLGGIQGIGKEGEDFHNLGEHEQNNLLGQMYYADNLPQINEAFMVKLEYKPALPAAPSGPQLGFVPMGPGMGGMGGGMRPMAPQPSAPMDYGQQPPPYYPPNAYPAYPPQNYQTAPGQPPMGQPPYPPQQPPYPVDPNMAHGQGYAQPHPYPSYPVPPHHGQPGYPYPPHGGGYPPPNWPPQGQAPAYPPPQWPPHQPAPVIIEAEEAKADTPAEKPADDASDQNT